MDEGKILLINLSNMDTNVKQVLGAFILSLLHLNALSRSNLPIEFRKQFHIHVDEAYQFMTDTFENLIAETRKYSVSLSLAHQYLSQFSKKKTDALSTVGSSIIFNVDKRDAEYLIKDLQGKVKVEELVSLGKGEAIAKIGSDIVRIKTRPPLPIPSKNFRDRIINESRGKYYKPASEIERWLKRRGDRWNCPAVPVNPVCDYTSTGDDEEFFYDEFD
jgi:type IV secretory pathway TraG/TraD family ATPase VirD4